MAEFVEAAQGRAVGAGVEVGAGRPAFDHGGGWRKWLWSPQL